MSKRIIFFTLLLIGTIGANNSAHAQFHTVGVRGAGTIGFANYEKMYDTIIDFGNYEVAFTYTYTGFQKYYGAIQGEIIYSLRGFTYEKIKDTDLTHTRKISSIEIPFLWRPYYTFSKDRGIVYAVLGMYLYYDIASTYEDKDLKNPNSSYNTGVMKYIYDDLKDNRLGIGVAGGIGFGWSIYKDFGLFVEGRYTYAFSNVLKPAAQYEGNPVQSTTSRISISFGLTYTINSFRRH